MIDLKRQADLRESIELFYFAYRAFTARPDEILEERGLGRVHHRILYFVGQHPDLTVGELLKILAVSKQALNAPLRTLLSLTLIEIRPSEEDRRFKRLRLTQEGAALEAALTSSQMDLLASVFGKGRPELEAAWKDVMRRVAGN